MFVSSRLGKTSSPQRDCSSLKGKVSHLSHNQAKHKQALTRSRLGEPLSPERDNTSLKTRALYLSSSSSRNLGQLLLFSPRRDKLAWAKIADLATVTARISRPLIPNSTFQAFYTMKTTYNSYRNEIKSKQVGHSKNI